MKYAVGQVDVVGGPVDGGQVHAPDGVDHGPRHVAVDPDVGLPGAAAEVRDGGPAAAGPQVPVVDEGVLHVPDDVAGQPGMGVAPVGGVQAADVVAAEEGDMVVDDQDLAMVAAGVAREPEAGGDQRVTANGDVGGEGVEAPTDHEVGELVEDHVDLDPPVGRLDQGILEGLADRIALPDEGLEEDPGLGLPDRVEHVAVEVLAVGVDGDLRTAGGHRPGRDPGEHGRLAQPLAAVVDHGQGEQGRTLNGHHRLHEADQDAADPDLSPLHDPQSTRTGRSGAARRTRPGVVSDLRI